MDSEEKPFGLLLSSQEERPSSIGVVVGLKGTVSIETSGQRFEETSKWIEEMSTKAGFPLKSKGAVILKIEEIYGVAPGPGAGKQLA